MFRLVMLRFVLPVVAASSVVAYLGLPYIDRLLSEWFRADVELRATLVMHSMEEHIAELMDKGRDVRLRGYLSKVTADERMLAILICRRDGSTVAKTDRTPASIACDHDIESGPGTRILQLPSGSVQVSQFAFQGAESSELRVLLVHDLSFVDRRQRTARDFMLVFVGISVLLLALLIVLVAWVQLRRLAKALIGDIRGRRFLDNAHSPLASLPILTQVREVLAEVEEKQRLEIDFQENWTPQALRQVVDDHLQASQVIVVSNREPYVHNFDSGGRPVVQVPASGMVTALEPIMRACSGVWVAHGAGTADRVTVDRYDQLRVPPDDPAYTLRRVWLTQEQERGYYYGFSNEGLWPLCHLAYVRPAFRADDWARYHEVNSKFADVVATEAATASPVVLIQDFHFALLPRLLRAKLPKATLVLFWHIPWPNAETFGICPWKREMLMHMLSADIVGFHTRYHCQNFLATVDRYIECQIDHEHMTITLQGRVCRVAPYPISIEWPPRWLKEVSEVSVCRAAVRQRYEIGANVQVCLGVERWDFTKGIVERFHALEVLLEKNARQRGKICLLQVAAPSRSELPAYQTLQQLTYQEAERINAKYSESGWRPIILIDRHQEPREVFELYRAADFCLVNSLHDGMNLVAKEFVAARDDDDGVLILSRFAGASRELGEAILVNPFDVNETADAMEAAVRMGRDERRSRMTLMRRTVKENNVYRWAGTMLMDAARIRQRQRLPSGLSRHATGTY